MPATTFKPHQIPRDRYDWRINGALCVGMIVLSGLLGGLATYAASLSLIAFLALLLAANLTYLAAALKGCVTKLAVADDGLCFTTLTGARRIPWSEIEEIAPVGRGEALRAWFRIPPHDPMAYSFSAAGYYRIRYRGGVAYFPPSDGAAFERAIRRHRASPAAPLSWLDAVRQVRARADDNLDRASAPLRLRR